MKRLTVLILAVLPVLTSGCITQSLIEDHAKPHEKIVSRETRPGEFIPHCETELVPGQPAYYSLLPLTIAGDVATAPIQVPIMIYGLLQAGHGL
jgi:lipoate-protein ligase B